MTGNRAGFRIGVGIAAAGLVLLALAPIVPGPAKAAGTKPPVFVGYCTPDAVRPEDGTCTLDEPEGQNPDTYGTVAYDRTVAGAQDELSFDLPTGLGATEVQVCLTLRSTSAVNPYVPTDANTCAGSSPDRAYQSNSPPDPVVVDLDAFFGSVGGYAPGDAVWFTVHVVAGGRTLAVTGGSAPGEPVTRTVTVTKDVDPDGSGTFAFTLDCVRTALSAANTTATGVTFDNGNASFSLGDGDAAVFTGIADDDTCIVTEDPPTAGSWTTTANGAAGRVATLSTADGNATAAFVNNPLFSLTVTKEVVSESGAEQFQFIVDCGAYVLSTGNNAATTVGYLNGDALFMLGRGGATTFTGIPAGTVCTVTETLEGTDGQSWTTTVSGTAGQAARVILDGDRTVPFVNSLTQSTTQTTPTTAATRVLGETVERELPQTGSLSRLLTLVGVYLVAGGTVMILAFRRRREAR